MQGVVLAVSSAAGHEFSKPVRERIRILAGLGVEGDAHLGETVKHRSRVRRDPTQPNLRQVHLMAGELLDELQQAGFTVTPGALGENITTRGLDLIRLPQGTRLRIGSSATLEVMGLRTPCVQMDGLQPGLMAATLSQDGDGNLVRKAGVMCVAVTDGEVRPGDRILVELPAEPRQPLGPV